MDKLFSFFGKEKVKTPISEDLPPRLMDVAPEIINKDELQEFRRWAKGRGEAVLFDKLIDNLRYIGQEDFGYSMDWMSNKINNMVGGDDYLLLYDMDGHSGHSITQKLTIKKPLATFPTHMSKVGNEARSLSPKVKKLVYVDDVAYSGTWVRSFTKEFLESSGYDSSILNILLVGSTTFGSEQIKKETKPSLLEYRYKVPSVDEVFNYNEQERLRNLFPEWNASYDQAVLTILWQKIADNFFSPLRKKSALTKVIGGEYKHLYLIDDSGDNFKPDYRK